MIKNNVKTKLFDHLFPFSGVFDDDNVAVHRRGPLMKGWRLDLPVAYSLDEDEYDALVEAFASAMLVLPAWACVHKQDIYTYAEYTPPAGYENFGFLGKSYYEHFKGRRYLTHRCYLYLSLATRNLIEKPAKQSILGKAPGTNIVIPTSRDVKIFESKCVEFISVLKSSGMVKAVELTKEDLVGKPGDSEAGGLVQEVFQLGDTGPVISDAILTPDSVEVGGKVLQSFLLGTVEKLPPAVQSVKIINQMSDGDNTVFLSSSSEIGMNLDCEHIVNQYFIVPDQAELRKDLDKTRKLMFSGSKGQAENKINSERIQAYLEDQDSNNLLTVYTHLNVLAWGKEEEFDAIRAMLSSAMSQMSMTATYGKYNTPFLYNAALPGNGFEIGKENLMRMEVIPALCMGIYETFTKDMKGGILALCDRVRNIPKQADFQKVAQSLGYVFDLNAFVLGPTGSGKSYFMNNLIRQCYDAGEHACIIDVGHSYETQCHIHQEESGGEDGVYMVWSRNSQYSFNPFLGCKDWLDEYGNLKEDDSDASFIISVLQTIWKPYGVGWTSDNQPILKQTVADFITSWNEERSPVLDDYYNYLQNVVAPQMDRGKYKVKDISVDAEDFDVRRFRIALSAYSLKGSYAQLLNNPNSIDYINKRFLYFEVSELAKIQDSVFYSICVLCIINQFDRKMRRIQAPKILLIEEAWKAIANETMEPYLRELWKTARKYNASAIVVTQQASDITGSDIIKDAILKNSSTRILLDQSNNRNDFDQISEALALSPKDVRQIFTINKARNPKYIYREAFVAMNAGHGDVYATELSPEEAWTYESEFAKKLPIMEKVMENGGSYIKAISDLVAAGIFPGGKKYTRAESDSIQDRWEAFLERQNIGQHSDDRKALPARTSHCPESESNEREGGTVSEQVVDLDAIHPKRDASEGKKQNTQARSADGRFLPKKKPASYTPSGSSNPASETNGQAFSFQIDGED